MHLFKENVKPNPSPRPFQHSAWISRLCGMMEDIQMPVQNGVQCRERAAVKLQNVMLLMKHRQILVRIHIMSDLDHDLLESKQI